MKLWRWVALDTLQGVTSIGRSEHEDLAVREERAQLRSAMEVLPEDLKRVIMLCEFSDFTYEQIAGILSIPVGTVGSRRNRALRLLRKTLSRA